mmetsp:Transcript_21907/g.51110  ORF Transcript_21907/g.51110 Transcript_21907/m.51110 type:complete len:87 (+) Transcript_21907:379-639(+)
MLPLGGVNLMELASRNSAKQTLDLSVFALGLAADEERGHDSSGGGRRSLQSGSGSVPPAALRSFCQLCEADLGAAQWQHWQRLQDF